MNSIINVDGIVSTAASLIGLVISKSSFKNLVSKCLTYDRCHGIANLSNYILNVNMLGMKYPIGT